MTRSFIDIWDWFNKFGEQATVVNDSERMRLYNIHKEAISQWEKYPEQALAMYREAQVLAEQLKEPWLLIFYECWTIEILIFGLDRYEDGLELAMKLIAKASQQTYLECPVRPWAFINLIVAYFKLDGLSYADEIHAMIETMDTKMALDKDSYLRLFAYRAQLCWLQSDYDRAIEAAQLYVEMSAEDTFRLADGYDSLCHLNYMKGNDQKAMEYSHLAQERAIKSNRRGVLINTHWWQATLLFLRGETEEAERLFWLGIGEAKQLERPKDVMLWGGACRYYEITGAYDKALLFWDEQIQLMNPQTPCRQIYFGIFLQRCFVLRKLGRLTAMDIEQTRQAALRMRKPEKYLALMEELHDGKTEIPRY